DALPISFRVVPIGMVPFKDTRFWAICPGDLPTCSSSIGPLTPRDRGPSRPLTEDRWRIGRESLVGLRVANRDRRGGGLDANATQGLLSFREVNDACPLEAW